MSSRSLLCLLFLYAPAAGQAQFDLEYVEAIEPLHYVAYRTSGAIAIDGKLDDYVPDKEGVFTTSAQCEGAIEGTGYEAFRLHPQLRPRLSIGDADFEIAFESSGKRADPRGVVRAFREGRSLATLSEIGRAHV